MISSASDAVTLSTNANGNRTVTLHVTTKRITLAILAAQSILLGLVGIDILGLDVPVFRELVAVFYLSIIPGFLVLQIIGVTARQCIEFALYSIGVSMTVLMALGVFFNFLLRFIGVPNPVSEVPMILSVSIAMTLLTWVYYRRTNQDTTVTITPARRISPLWLSLALLPLLGVYGALALTVYDTNLLLLGLFAVIALLPLLVLSDRIPTAAWPAVLWAVSLSLLLQNALTGNYLAWGDQPKEATLALFVLSKGFWDPSVAVSHSNKFAMLRIVLLHPMYALFSDLDIVWVFKLVHPVLFSITPVVLYQTYQKFTSRKVAFLSAYLYMSLFSFFIVLSRNTRTATALLFLALLGLLVADDTVHDQRAKLLAILFGLSIIVSHYGVSYITMVALPVVLLVTPLLERLTNTSTNTTDNTHLSGATTSVAYVGAYLTATFGWYIYLSPNSSTFILLYRFTEHFITTLRQEFISSSISTTTRIVTSDWQSITLEILKYYNIGIGALIALGLAATLVRRFVSPKTDHGTVDTEYLAFALVFFGLFGMTFLPVEQFNTARTFPTSLIFFAPFFVLGIGELFWAGKRVLSLPLSTSSIHHVAAVILVLYLLLNSGFLSATITHEYSPNALVEKDRIMDDGRPAEKAYFYKQYPMVYEGAATEWLRANVKSNAVVHASQWPGNPIIPVGYEHSHDTEQLRHPTIRPIPEEGPITGGYVYLGPFSTIGNIVKYPGGHFEYQWAYTSDVRSQWRHKNRIYDNGGSVIYK